MKTPYQIALITLMSCTALAVSAANEAKKPADKSVQLAKLSADQISTAQRVLTGPIACEFGQSVEVKAVAGREGWFDVSYKGKHYMMAPEATSTGAVRLEDKKAGMMWLQIANKSMLMNTKLGQRMVDNCVHATQRS